MASVYERDILNALLNSWDQGNHALRTTPNPSATTNSSVLEIEGDAIEKIAYILNDVIDPDANAIRMV